MHFSWIVHGFSIVRRNGRRFFPPAGDTGRFQVDHHHIDEGFLRAALSFAGRPWGSGSTAQQFASIVGRNGCGNTDVGGVLVFRVSRISSTI